MKKASKKIIALVMATMLLVPMTLVNAAAIPNVPEDNAELVTGAPTFLDTKYTYSNGTLTSTSDGHATDAGSSAESTYAEYPLNASLTADSKYVITYDIGSLALNPWVPPYHGMIFIFRKDTDGNYYGWKFEDDYIMLSKYTLSSTGILTHLSNVGAVHVMNGDESRSPVPNDFNGKVMICSAKNRVDFEIYDNTGTAVKLYYEQSGQFYELGTNYGYDIAGGAPAAGVCFWYATGTAKVSVKDTAAAPGLPATGAYNNGVPDMSKATDGYYTYSGTTLTKTTTYGQSLLISYPLKSTVTADVTYVITADLKYTERDMWNGPAFYFRKNTDGKLIGIWMQNAIYFGEFSVNDSGVVSLSTNLGEISDGIASFDGKVRITSAPGAVKFELLNKDGTPYALRGATEIIKTFDKSGDAFFGLTLGQTVATVKNARVDPYDPGSADSLITGAPTLSNERYSYVFGALTNSVNGDTNHYYVSYPLSDTLTAQSAYTVTAEFTNVGLNEWVGESGPITVFRKDADGNYLGFWMQKAIGASAASGISTVYLGKFTLSEDQLALSEVIGSFANPTADNSGKLIIDTTPAKVTFSIANAKGELYNLYEEQQQLSWDIAGGAPAVGVSFHSTTATAKVDVVPFKYAVNLPAYYVEQDYVQASKVKAPAGETVTVDFTNLPRPLKANTLKVVDANGNAVRVERSGYQTGDTQSRVFEFVMPAGDVTVDFAIYNTESGTTETNANMAALGAQYFYNGDDNLDGIRFGSQVYVNKDGKFRVNGVDYELESAGTLIALTENLNKIQTRLSKTTLDDTLTLDTCESAYADYIIHVEQKSVYDRANEYYEFVGGIIGLSGKISENTQLTGRGYIKATDGTVFYTEVMTREFADPN